MRASSRAATPPRKVTLGIYVPGTYPATMVRWPRYRYRVRWLDHGTEFTTWAEAQRHLARLDADLRDHATVERSMLWPRSIGWRRFDVEHPMVPDGWTYDADAQLVTIGPLRVRPLGQFDDPMPKGTRLPMAVPDARTTP
jgi:hypothetical protein